MGVLAMKTDRLMAFTDAVLAIVITIMSSICAFPLPTPGAKSNL